MYGGDEVNAVVLDVGSCSTKAGYAGEDAPKAVFPTACGLIRTGDGGANEDGSHSNGSTKDRTIYVGTQALGHKRAHMEVVSALQDGIYSDWDLIESVWHHAFSDQLRLRAQEHPVMLAEPTSNPQHVREKAAELMFEKFCPPALFMAKNAVLSSFATGRQTSLVLDLGFQGSIAAAVHDGFVLQNSIVRSPVAGKLLTECMLQSVQSKGAALQPFYAMDKMEAGSGHLQATKPSVPGPTESFWEYHIQQVAADIKESICRVSDTPFEAEANANIPTVDYELPDGTLVQVGPDRFSVPEVLFQPSLLKSFGGVQPVMEKGMQLSSIQESITTSIERCDVDARRELYSGVVATGGTSMFPQLRDRLERELNNRTPPAAKVKVIIPTNPIERRYSVWIGGSILASLGSFQQMWLSKSEYEEHGASLIHRKIS